MALEIKQSVRLAQQLVVTPQLQQAIRLLQLSRMELATMIQKELTENPCLEEEEEESETVKLETPDEGEHGEIHEKAKELDKGHEHPIDEVGTSKENNPQEPANFDWENYINQTDSPSGAYERNLDGPDERPTYENVLKKPESLQDHLLWQLGLANFSEEEIIICEEIIGNINDDGYLQAGVEEIAATLQTTPEKVETLLKKIQAFDPIGCGSRTVQECLLLQAENLEGQEGIWIKQMITDHLKNLELHNYKPIAKALGLPVEKILELEKAIHQYLDPKPGRAFSTVEPQYITPDVYVIKRGNDYAVTLNEDGLPKLTLSPLYRRAIMGAEGFGDQTKNYIQEKLKQALWLIKSIHQRQQTLYKVTKSIVKFQKDFFDKGITSLKPMVLKDVAEDIGMHESTVSRVTTNKYAHTPQGLLELKYFFNSSLGAKEGDGAVASEVVKEYIQNLIGEEKRAQPFSDQEIAKILKEKHKIDIARRTVAKYREMLGILPSSRRRHKL